MHLIGIKRCRRTSAPNYPIETQAPLIPIPGSQPPEKIPDPEAWENPKYQNTIRKRLKKILCDAPSS